MPRSSDLRKLSELVLSRAGTDLESVVTSLRSQGLGWRGVSGRLKEHYGLEIHSTTLLRWFPDEPAQRAS